MPETIDWKLKPWYNTKSQTGTKEEHLLLDRSLIPSRDSGPWVLFESWEQKVEEFYNIHLPADPVNPKADWTNVRGHCVTVAERVLTIWLRLFPLTSQDAFGYRVVIGALLHDACKKYEIEYTGANGKSWEAFDHAYRYSETQLANFGFANDLVVLAGSVEHDSLVTTQEILQRKQIGPLGLGALVIHYVDDFTLGSQPVTPTSDGVNDLDRRMAANEANEKYRVLNEEGRAHFGGKSCYEMQRGVGEKIQEYLAGKLGIPPVFLPEIVDQWVREMKQQA